MPPERTNTDHTLLRRAIAEAQAAADAGRRPFAALVARADGSIVAEASAVPPTESRDWTAHSEMLALRTASARLTWSELAECTLYASTEPCPMCVAALYWCNLPRLVFGASEPAVRALRQRFTRAAGIAMSAREVLARAPREITIIGPLLEEEALAPHRGFWDGAAESI